MKSQPKNPLQKTLSIIGSIFLIIGIVDLVICGFIYQNTQTFLVDAIPTQGTVVDLSYSRNSGSNSYYPIVQFTTKQGEMVEFQADTGSNPPTYQTGDAVAILYSEATPETARIDSFTGLWLLPIIFALIGGLFVLAGIGLFAYLFYTFKIRPQRDEQLRNEGKILLTQYSGVELNSQIKINRRSPYRIISQWHNPTENKMYTFKSDNIWFDPEELARDREIKVYVNPDNYQQYYMDIEFLPELAN